MTTPADKAADFLALHRPGSPVLMPNPWDVGSAKLFVSLGFTALATTSSGFAGTLGRLDGDVTRDEVIAHGAQLAAAVDVPVSADLENGYGDRPDDAAETIRQAAAAGLAGGSIEDYGRAQDEIYELGLATDRVRAAAEAARAGPHGFVLTARAENLIRGRVDLPDTIARLQAFQEAGADVLFAPGLRAITDVEAVVRSVDLPVNVLAGPGGPTIPELAAAGVARVSVGGSFSYVAINAVAIAARELLEEGTLGYADQVVAGGKLARTAFG